MARQGLRNSYIITLGKFLLFLIFFCFLVETIKNFLQELKATPEFDVFVLYLAILTSFIFYTFIADLNNIYNKIQNFFFRGSYFSLVIPSLLIILALVYFLIPKLLKFSLNKDLFLFTGGFVFNMHLIFIANKTKTSSFVGFVNYLFIFSILFVVNFLILGIYLKIEYKIDLGKIIIDSIRDSSSLVKGIFSQVVN